MFAIARSVGGLVVDLRIMKQYDGRDESGDSFEITNKSSEYEIAPMRLCFFLCW